MAKINGFILDIDGTLVDATEAHYEAWQYALKKHNIILPKADVIKQFGKATSKIALIFAENDEDLGKLIAEEKTAYLLKIIKDIPLFSGVKETINIIVENGGKICFASSNFNIVIEEFVRANNWDEISVGFVGIDDVLETKPHPDMILKCVEKLNCIPDECVMIGDSLYDVQAGNAAGTKTIGVCTGHNTVERFMKHNPSLVLNSIAELSEKIPLIL